MQAFGVPRRRLKQLQHRLPPVLEPMPPVLIGGARSKVFKARSPAKPRLVVDFDPPDSISPSCLFASLLHMAGVCVSKGSVMQLRADIQAVWVGPFTGTAHSCGRFPCGRMGHKNWVVNRGAGIAPHHSTTP
eukprot:5917965-Amphidinium_carterae.1